MVVIEMVVIVVVGVDILVEALLVLIIEENTVKTDQGEMIMEAEVEVVVEAEEVRDSAEVVTDLVEAVTDLVEPVMIAMKVEIVMPVEIDIQAEEIDIVIMTIMVIMGVKDTTTGMRMEEIIAKIDILTETVEVVTDIVGVGVAPPGDSMETEEKVMKEDLWIDLKMIDRAEVTGMGLLIVEVIDTVEEVVLEDMKGMMMDLEEEEEVD